MSTSQIPCVECGKLNSKEALFCGDCGLDLAKTVNPIPVQKSVEPQIQTKQSQYAEPSFNSSQPISPNQTTQYTQTDMGPQYTQSGMQPQYVQKSPPLQILNTTDAVKIMLGGLLLGAAMVLSIVGTILDG